MDDFIEVDNIEEYYSGKHIDRLLVKGDSRSQQVESALVYDGQPSVLIFPHQRNYIYDLSHFPSVREITFIYVNPNLFSNIPASLESISVENLQNINPELLHNITDLWVSELDISDFLKVLPHLRHLVVLTAFTLIGEDCSDYEKFVNAFACHPTWKYLYKDFKVRNKTESGDCGFISDNVVSTKRKFTSRADYLKLSKDFFTKQLTKACRD